jgi:hypothetical protein
VYFNYAAAPERRNTVAPAKGQGSMRNTIVTDKDLDVGVVSEYEATIHMDPDVVDKPDIPTAKESTGDGRNESDRLTTNVATAESDARVQHVERVVREW